jgi:hypothetical protein
VHAVHDEEHWRSAARDAFARWTTSAIARIGSRTPVLECTQVTPSTRVAGVSAFSTRAATSATETWAASS